MALTVLIWLLVVEHVYALVTPPYDPGIEHAFHLGFGLAYAWLAGRVGSGRRAPRIVLTVLLGIQFIGRFFVFAAISETWIRLSLIPGTLITLVVIVLLWRPAPLGTRGRRRAEPVTGAREATPAPESTRP